MKGVKTEVKTDWKNLAHGNKRESVLSLDGIYVTGVTPGATLHVSYHMKSNMSANVIPVWDSGNWSMDVHSISEAGETDMSYTILCQKTDVPYTTSKIRFYTNTGAKVVLSNFMANEGTKPLSYIDSDELKAMGGAINKARIVALVLSEERRAA